MSAPVHSRFATTDPEQAQALIADAYADNKLRISGDRSDFHFQHERWAAGMMSVSLMSNTLTIAMDLKPMDTLWICDIRRATLQNEVEHVTRHYGVGDVFLAAPLAIEYRNELQGYADRPVGLDPSVFCEVTGDEAFDPLSRLRLDPLPPQAAASWRRTVDFVKDSVLSNPEAAANPLLVGSAQRLLAATLLHGYGLEPPETAEMRRDATPASVRRAVAFIQNNPELDISVADIARAAHVSVRAVQLAFRRHLDTTPMRYLRRVRLDLAHTDLQATNPADGVTVTDIAMRWGYADPSRFAAEYRTAYGEHPHVTLRRTGD
jgi:AraC-like DNA-binding protein